MKAFLSPLENNEPTFAWTEMVWFYRPVSFNKIVYIFHRENDNSIVDAISQNTGRKIWTFTYPTDYVDDFGFDKGPRAVPLVHDDIIYIYGAEGMLCFGIRTGKVIWKKNLLIIMVQRRVFLGEHALR